MRRTAPSQVQGRGQTVTEEARQKREATLRVLVERWPKCFAVDEKQRRPLKIGIGEEIAGILTDIDVSVALALYTRSPSYIEACVAGAVRIGLDGEPAGTVTAQQAAFARKIAAMQKRRETKQGDAARRPTLSLPSLRPKPRS
jgi:ProP effector